MTKYSLVFKNASSQFGSLCVYQTNPDISDPGVMSLAWFAKAAHPTTKVVFTWETEYSFVWDETGLLRPGVIFDASQAWPADPQSMNQVTFTYSAGAYTFKDVRRGPRPNSLYINQEITVPANQASVGIGMSGAGTFVVQAQPNMNLIFSPHPKYWVTFGNFIQGQVLDITEISNKAEVLFPNGIYSMDVTLNQDNTWTVLPSTT
ncbi:MAG: protein rhiA [Bacillota bacterium]